MSDKILKPGELEDLGLDLEDGPTRKTDQDSEADEKEVIELDFDTLS